MERPETEAFTQKDTTQFLKICFIQNLLISNLSPGVRDYYFFVLFFENNFVVLFLKRYFVGSKNPC